MIITGTARLGRDAEVRYTPNGNAVASLALVFNYGQKGQDGRKPSQWIEGALWGKQAEALAQYLTKGTQITVVISDPHIETYKKGDGAEGSKMVGTVINVELIGSSHSQSNSQSEREPAPKQVYKGQDRQSDLGQDDDFPF